MCIRDRYWRVITMASEKITAIIESVKGLTVLELKELIDTYCRCV